MRSGGLRGLQIPWSGAFGVRGGFDSHAFPPIAAAICILAAAFLLTAAPAHAQPPVPGRDTSATAPSPPAPESSPAIKVVGEGVTPPPPDTSRRKLPWHEQPRFVMARSLIVPGWGQLHNRSWIKAGLVAAAETWLGVSIVKDQRRLDDLLQEIDATHAGPDSTASERRRREAALVTEYNALLDQRLGRQWLLGGVLAYALVDAYVDAHFRDFDLEFQNDPALPPGSSPAAPAKQKNRLGFRVAIRRHF